MELGRQTHPARPGNHSTFSNPHALPPIDNFSEPRTEKASTVSLLGISKTRTRSSVLSASHLLAQTALTSIGK